MGAGHKEFDLLLGDDAIGNEPFEIIDFEFVYSDACQVADLFITYRWILCNSFYGSIQ